MGVLLRLGPILLAWGGFIGLVLSARHFLLAWNRYSPRRDLIKATTLLVSVALYLPHSCLDPAWPKRCPRAYEYK